MSDDPGVKVPCPPSTAAPPRNRAAQRNCAQHGRSALLNDHVPPNVYMDGAPPTAPRPPLPPRDSKRARKQVNTSLSASSCHPATLNGMNCTFPAEGRRRIVPEAAKCAKPQPQACSVEPFQQPLDVEEEELTQRCKQEENERCERDVIMQYFSCVHTSAMQLLFKRLFDEEAASRSMYYGEEKQARRDFNVRCRMAKSAIAHVQVIESQRASQAIAKNIQAVLDVGAKLMGNDPFPTSISATKRIELQNIRLPAHAGVMICVQESEGRDAINREETEGRDAWHVAQAEDLEASRQKVHRRNHQLRLAFWRRQREDKEAAAQAAANLAEMLEACQRSEEEERSALQATEEPERHQNATREVNLRHGLQRKSLLSEEALNRGVVDSAMLREKVELLLISEYVGRDALASHLWSARETWLTALYADHHEAASRLEKRSHAALTIQRYFRRTLRGLFGWRLSHRRAGESILMMRAKKKASCATHPSAELLRVRQELAEAAAACAEEDRQIRIHFEADESRHRRDLEGEEVWWYRALLRMRLTDFASSISIPTQRQTLSDEQAERKLLCTDEVMQFQTTSAQFQSAVELQRELETGLPTREDEERRRIVRDGSSIYSTFCSYSEFLEELAVNGALVDGLERRFCLQAMEGLESVSRKDVQWKEVSVRGRLLVEHSFKELLHHYSTIQRLTYFSDSIFMAELKQYSTVLASQHANLCHSILCLREKNLHALQRSVVESWEDSADGGRPMIISQEAQERDAICAEQFNRSRLDAEEKTRKKLAAAKVIVDFWRDTRRFVIGRTALRRYLHEAFREKRERCEYQRARTQNSMAVMRAQEELAEAVREHNQATQSEYSRRLRYLARLEPRERASILAEEGLISRITHNNFVLYAIELLKELLSRSQRDEGSSREQILADEAASIKEILEQATASYLDVSALSVQSFSRCALARLDWQKRIHNRISTTLEEERTQRHCFERQRLEDFYDTFNRSVQEATLTQEWAASAIPSVCSLECLKRSAVRSSEVYAAILLQLQQEAWQRMLMERSEERAVRLLAKLVSSQCLQQLEVSWEEARERSSVDGECRTSQGEMTIGQEMVHREDIAVQRQHCLMFHVVAMAEESSRMTLEANCVSGLTDGILVPLEEAERAMFLHANSCFVGFVSVVLLEEPRRRKNAVDAFMCERRQMCEVMACNSKTLLYTLCANKVLPLIEDGERKITNDEEETAARLLLRDAEHHFIDTLEHEEQHEGARLGCLMEANLDSVLLFSAWCLNDGIALTREHEAVQRQVCEEERDTTVSAQIRDFWCNAITEEVQKEDAARSSLADDEKVVA